MPKKAGVDKSQTLPPKEAAIFKNVVQFYEKKQYKKGVKAADQILKKHPEHGETLAMKGLTINCLGDDKKEEAYALVKMGIKFNMMSHVCWHVYGLLYRSDRDYNAAIRSYNQALKMDKDNLQILRDLALLQIHMRDLSGGLKTRNTLLMLKPTQRANWMGFAMANHMLGRHQTATKVLEAYENIQDENDGPYEISELILYKVSILVEAGDLAGAYEVLQTCEAKIRDKLAMHEANASLLLKLERFEEASAAYRKLIDINVDNLKYHEGLQEALKGCGSSGSEEALLEEYTSLRAKFPKSNAPTRIILDFSSGTSFKKYADIYIRKFLRRGIQSLFSDLKPLYSDTSKVELLSELYCELFASIEKDGTFPPSESEPEPAKEGPMVVMWLNLLLANHYDRAGQPVKALECVERGIEHTATSIELQLCKARVLKHHGNLQEAAEVIDKARTMDLADRYLNTRCTIYMLRADQFERAEKVVVLFTKEELTGQNNLYDMQCMWWETECGNTFIRQGRWAEALKKLTAVEKHFEDIHEDQFDFHSYCLRKMTLRSYMGMLRTQDQIRTNKFFLKAAQSIIHICLHLHENPPAVVDPEAEFAGMDEKERKKAIKKKQRDEKRKAEQEAKKKEEAAKNKKKGPIDEDPLGEKLLKDTCDAERGPLTLATKYVKLLQQAWPNKTITHVLAYRVYRRLNKYMLCAQAVLRASKLDAADAELHACVLDFCSLELPAETNALVTEVYNEVKQEILSGHDSCCALTTKFREEHGMKSAAHKMAAARGMLQVDSSKTDDAVALLTNASCQTSWEDATKIYTQLKEWLGEDARVPSYYDACATAYPCAAFFNPAAAPGEAATE
jgi:peptide alpha-N-acetyltransferase